MNTLELALLDFQDQFALDRACACKLVERLLTDPQAVSYRIAWNDARRRKAEEHFSEWQFYEGDFRPEVERIVDGVYSAVSSGAIAPHRIDQLLNDSGAVRRAHERISARSVSVAATDMPQRGCQPIIHSIMEAIKALLPNELPVWEPRLSAWNLALPNRLGIVDKKDSFDLRNPAGIVLTRVTGARALAWRVRRLPRTLEQPNRFTTQLNLPLVIAMQRHGFLVWTTRIQTLIEITYAWHSTFTTCFIGNSRSRGRYLRN